MVQGKNEEDLVEVEEERRVSRGRRKQKRVKNSHKNNNINRSEKAQPKKPNHTPTATD